MIEQIAENQKFNLIFQKEEENGNINFRIFRKTSDRLSDVKAFAKFYYYKSAEIESDFFEIINFRDNTISESEATSIYEFIERLFVDKKIADLYSSIKLIKSTFGNSLSFTKKDIIGKIGELILILELLKYNIDLTKYFNNNNLELYDFYITNNESYLEVKTSTKETNAVTLNIKQLSFNPDKTAVVMVKVQEDKNGIRLKDIIKELININSINIDFRDFLIKLQNETDFDLFAEEISIDKNNIFFKLFLPKDLKNKIPLLESISNFNEWENIEKISLKINFSGIASSKLTDIRQFLEQSNE